MVSPTEVRTNNNNQGEVIMTTQTDQGSGGLEALAHDECGNVRVSVFFPDYNIQVSQSASLTITQTNVCSDTLFTRAACNYVRLRVLG